MATKDEKLEELENKECPFCEELLEFKKDGVMKNQKTGEILYTFTCEECNQAFALDDDGQLKIIPYDSEVKLIENKCKKCGKVENYNEKGLFLLNVDTAYYDFYCFGCAIPILQEWVDNNSKEKIKVTMDNINDIYQTYDTVKNQELVKEFYVIFQMKNHRRKNNE